MKKKWMSLVLAVAMILLCIPTASALEASEITTYSAKAITDDAVLAQRAFLGIDERSEETKRKGEWVVSTQGSLAQETDAFVTTQLVERTVAADGKISESYQTTAVTRSKSSNYGDDNAFAYVKIYWRVETDPYTLIDEYFFVKSEHWYTANSTATVYGLEAWNCGTIHTAGLNYPNQAYYSSPVASRKYTLSSATNDPLTVDGGIGGRTKINMNYGSLEAVVSYAAYT